MGSQLPVYLEIDLLSLNTIYKNVYKRFFEKEGKCNKQMRLQLETMIGEGIQTIALGKMIAIISYFELSFN